MQFILERQAQSASDIHQIREVIKAQQEQLTVDINQINTVLLDVATSQQTTNEIVAVLAERQVKTEETLHSLIETVNRHIAGHH